MEGYVNYVPLPIRDDGDVSIMFIVVAQSPPPNTIEMYCQTSSIDYHPMPSSFTTPMHIESLDMAGLLELIVMTIRNYLFDEDDGNEDIMDMEDNENTENDASLLGGELNWDAINSMVDMDLIAHTDLWNESMNFAMEMYVYACVMGFGACVEGFKHCRPIIQIDDTFIYGKYIRKLLIATSIDADGIIDSWSWFLYTLRSQATQREGICLISNRHAGIQAAIRDPSVGWNPPYAHHRYCLRHVASNFNDKYRNKMLKDLVYRAGSQHQPRKYESCMIELKRLDEKCLEWFNKLDTKKWTLAHDGGHRYGWMTTNIVECINGVLKGLECYLSTLLFD
ncbi:hypothetical protein AAG906_005521 [Vitis piasezkii]